ncbi:hypothetical protein ALC53_04175, partial [Atta colombica]
GATRHKHSIAWHGISIDIYTVSMGISTRSDSGRAPPNTADSDPARSTQTRESIVAFKLPSYSGGLSLPEFRATSGRIRTGNTHVKISSLIAHYRVRAVTAPISYIRAMSRSLRNIRRQNIRENRVVRFALFAGLHAPKACLATVINAVSIYSFISLFLLFLTCTVDVFSLTYIIYHREDIFCNSSDSEFLFQRRDRFAICNVIPR